MSEFNAAWTFFESHTGARSHVVAENEEPINAVENAVEFHTRGLIFF